MDRNAPGVSLQRRLVFDVPNVVSAASPFPWLRLHLLDLFGISHLFVFHDLDGRSL